jgi:predicted small lipoprotein YifL
MNRLALLLFVAMTGCGGKQPLRVDCDDRLVPINGTIEEIDDARSKSQPEEEESRP